MLVNNNFPTTHQIICRILSKCMCMVLILYTPSYIHNYIIIWYWEGRVVNVHLYKWLHTSQAWWSWGTDGWHYWVYKICYSMLWGEKCKELCPRVTHGLKSRKKLQRCPNKMPFHQLQKHLKCEICAHLQTCIWNTLLMKMLQTWIDLSWWSKAAATSHLHLSQCRSLYCHFLKWSCLSFLALLWLMCVTIAGCL